MRINAPIKGEIPELRLQLLTNHAHDPNIRFDLKHFSMMHAVTSSGIRRGTNPVREAYQCSKFCKAAVFFVRLLYIYVAAVSVFADKNVLVFLSPWRRPKLMPPEALAPK